MNDTQTIRIFDVNNNLVDDFDEQVEKVLISVHGNNYYDVDEELVDTRLIPLKEVVSNKKEEEVEKVEHTDKVVKNISNKKKSKVKFTDFLPVLFFILLFTIIVYAGYTFIGNFDISSILGG